MRNKNVNYDERLSVSISPLAIEDVSSVAAFRDLIDTVRFREEFVIRVGLFFKSLDLPKRKGDDSPLESLPEPMRQRLNSLRQVAEDVIAMLSAKPLPLSEWGPRLGHIPHNEGDDHPSPSKGDVDGDDVEKHTDSAGGVDEPFRDKHKRRRLNSSAENRSRVRMSSSSDANGRRGWWARGGTSTNGGEGSCYPIVHMTPFSTRLKHILDSDTLAARWKIVDMCGDQFLSLGGTSIAPTADSNASQSGQGDSRAGTTTGINPVSVFHALRPRGQPALGSESVTSERADSSMEDGGKKVNRGGLPRDGCWGSSIVTSRWTPSMCARNDDWISHLALGPQASVRDRVKKAEAVKESATADSTDASTEDDDGGKIPDTALWQIGSQPTAPPAQPIVHLKRRARMAGLKPKMDQFERSKEMFNKREREREREIKERESSGANGLTDRDSSNGEMSGKDGCADPSSSSSTPTSTRSSTLSCLSSASKPSKATSTPLFDEGKLGKMPTLNRERLEWMVENTQLLPSEGQEYENAPLVVKLYQKFEDYYERIMRDMDPAEGVSVDERMLSSQVSAYRCRGLVNKRHLGVYEALSKKVPDAKQIGTAALHDLVKYCKNPQLTAPPSRPQKVGTTGTPMGTVSPKVAPVGAPTTPTSSSTGTPFLPLSTPASGPTSAPTSAPSTSTPSTSSATSSSPSPLTAPSSSSHASTTSTASSSPSTSSTAAPSSSPSTSTKSASAAKASSEEAPATAGKRPRLTTPAITSTASSTKAPAAHKISTISSAPSSLSLASVSSPSSAPAGNTARSSPKVTNSEEGAPAKRLRVSAPTTPTATPSPSVSTSVTTSPSSLATSSSALVNSSSSSSASSPAAAKRTSINKNTTSGSGDKRKPSVTGGTTTITVDGEDSSGSGGGHQDSTKSPTKTLPRSLASSPSIATPPRALSPSSPVVATSTPRALSPCKRDGSDACEIDASGYASDHVEAVVEVEMGDEDSSPRRQLSAKAKVDGG
eukprot:GHVN01059291.1.p1 GENE.GHVN01059291.1~~GHVN01059291.1.p1  ORF type:complete len:999 (-),score=228.64 GHVN01059291.1:4272-7268(-)